MLAPSSFKNLRDAYNGPIFLLPENSDKKDEHQINLTAEEC